MKRPRISVLVPTYNNADLLGLCLSSILGQSIDDFELLVSDNCSTDATPGVLAGVRDSRLRIFRQERNLGPHGNMNFLISRAAAPVVKLFCSDDIMNRSLLARQVAVLDEHPKVGVVSCDALITSADAPTEVWRCRHGYWTGNSLLRESLQRASNDLGNPSSFMFRREAIPPLGFDPAYAFISDLVIIGRILESGWHYSGLDYVGFQYQRHAGADTNRVQHAFISDWINLMQESHYLPWEGIVALAERCTQSREEVLLAGLLTQLQDGLSVRVAGDLLDRFKTTEGRMAVRDFLRDGRRLAYFRHRLRGGLTRAAAKILQPA